MSAGILLQVIQTLLAILLAPLLMGWVIHVTSARVPFALGSGAALVCAIGVLGRRSVRAAATV